MIKIKDFSPTGYSCAENQGFRVIVTTSNLLFTTLTSGTQLCVHVARCRCMCTHSRIVKDIRHNLMWLIVLLLIWTSVQRDVTGIGIRLKQSVLINFMYYRKDFFFIFKGSPSRKERKTCFSVLTTIELNLPVEFTNPANDGLRTINLKKS